MVGIHQASLDHADQERAIAELVAAIEATGRFDALPPTEVATTIAGRESVVLEEGLLAAGRQQLTSGKNAYNQASPDDAIPHLESAIESLRAAFSGTNTADDLWEAWVYLGTSHLQRDPPDEAAARAALSQAIALSPSRPLNPALYPPNVMELFGDLQTALQSQVTSLSITTDGPANVWIDGVDKGASPVVVSGVVPGVHHVLARGESVQAYAQVDVVAPVPPDPSVPAAPEAVPGAPQAVALTLGPMRLGEGSPSAVGRSNEVASTYLALGNRADGLDYLLIVGVADSVLEVQLLGTTTDTFSKAIELPYGDDADDEAAQAVPLLLNGIDGSGGFAATAAVPAPIDIGANSELALLLTGRITPIPVGAIPLDTQPPPQKKSKLGAVLGIVGGVVVAGAAGTGTWLYLQGQQDPDQGSIIVSF